MQGQIQLKNYNQVLGYARRLSEEEKDKLFFALRNDRLKSLLAKLRGSTKGLSLTYEEITEEVEAVRKARYEDKAKK